MSGNLCQMVCVCEASEDESHETGPPKRGNPTQTCGAPGGVRMSHQMMFLSGISHCSVPFPHPFIKAMLLLDSLSCIRRLSCIQRICRFGFMKKLVKPDPRLSRTLSCSSAWTWGLSEERNFNLLYLEHQAIITPHPSKPARRFGLCLLAVDYCQASKLL